MAEDIAQMLSRLSEVPRSQTSARKFSGIYINYRREDSAAHAGRVFDKLADHFGRDRIFMDVDTIEPGEDFAEVIENAVSSCDIQIVIIGRHWLSERLNEQYDFVRLEIALALRRDIPVIPVLVQGASMPNPKHLPKDLAKLAYLNAIELSDSSWRANVNQLIDIMERILAARGKVVRRDAGVIDPDEPRRTIESLEQRLALAREAGDHKSEIIALEELGAAYTDLGETRRAIEFFEQALRIHREMGNRKDEGNMLRKLGRSHAELGETRQAIEFFEQALLIHREMGDQRMESNALQGLGAAYAEMGESGRAKEFFEQALRIHRAMGDRRGEGIALSSLGTAYSGMGESRRALEFFEQAIDIDREMGDRTSEGADLSSLSMALNEVGERSQAIKYAELALTIFEELEDPRAAAVRAQLADWREPTSS